MPLNHFQIPGALSYQLTGTTLTAFLAELAGLVSWLLWKGSWDLKIISMAYFYITYVKTEFFVYSLAPETYSVVLMITFNKKLK